MGPSLARRRSRVPWALAVVVGLCSGLAGYVIRTALVRRVPKQVVTVKRLTDMPGPEETPAISPDGKAIAFVAVSGNRRQIWIGRAAITKDDADHDGPRWSPDSSSLIYFASGAIWKIPAVGGEARRLVDAMAPGDLNHAGQLAFFRRGEGALQLMVDEHRVATLTGGGTYSNLRWSPDDKKIAYLENTKIMVVSASGGTPVPAADVAVQGFAWAPDNSGLIASTHGELWFLPRVERESPWQLTFGELSYESPDISAEGTVAVSRRGLNSDKEADIVVFSGLKW